MSMDEPVVVMDQFADTAARCGFSDANLPQTITDSGTVAMIAQPVTGLLMLRASSNMPALSDALRQRCNLPLSSRLYSETHDAYCVRWMAPDNWLLSCPLNEAFDIEQSLRADTAGHIAIVNLSGGYSVMELSGRDARSVLMKSTGYDVHPDHFSVGKVVNTTFAKAQVTLRVIELGESDARYEIIVRRSFSDYLWAWLQCAGAEYGMTTTRSAS